MQKKSDLGKKNDLPDALGSIRLGEKCRRDHLHEIEIVLRICLLDGIFCRIFKKMEQLVYLKRETLLRVPPAFLLSLLH